MLNERYHLFTSDRGELCEKLIDAVPGFEMIEERPSSDACAGKARGAVHDFWIDGDDRRHAQIIAWSPFAKADG